METPREKSAKALRQYVEANYVVLNCNSPSLTPLEFALHLLNIDPTGYLLILVIKATNMGSDKAYKSDEYRDFGWELFVQLKPYDHKGRLLDTSDIFTVFGRTSLFWPNRCYEYLYKRYNPQKEDAKVDMLIEKIDKLLSAIDLAPQGAEYEKAKSNFEEKVTKIT